MLSMGDGGGVVAATFIQILKTVVHIGKTRRGLEYALYFNLTWCFVYKFTASLPETRYKRKITFKSGIKVAATSPPFPLTT